MKPSELAKKKREQEGVQAYQRNTYTPPEGFYEKYRAATQKQDDWRQAAIERLTPKALTPPTQAGPTYLEKLAENREKAKQLSARVPETATAAGNIREMIFGKPIEAGTVNPRISAADFSTRYDSMTDREKAAYTYLKNTDAKKADEYLKAIEMDINARNAEKRVADAKKIAEESAAAGLYERFMGNNVVSNGAAAAYELWQGLRNQPVDPNHPLLAGQDIVKGQNEAFVGDSKGIERYLREGAMGAFDFGTNIALGGAMGLKGVPLQNMVKGSFAAQAFAGSAHDAAEREGTGMQSVMTGAASAALATIIEGIGLERLMEIGRMANARGVLKSMAKSIVPEGLEEGVEEAGNILADAVIMGDKNEIVGLYNTARANGATQNDAMMAALGQAGKQIGESAIIGGISGGLIGGGVAMTNRALGGNVLENDVPDTNVGETEQLNTATPQNPVTGHETAISDELTDSSPATKTQPTEAQTKQERDRDSYLDKYYHENGANILRAEGERLGSLKDAEDIYRSYYTAGVMGLNFDEVEQTAFTPLADKSVATEMYKAGVNDKAADMEARIKGQDKLRRSKAGVDLMTEAITEQQKALANLVAKVGGMKVTIVDTLGKDGKEGNNGEYTRGTNEVVIAMDAESFSGTLFHETVHYIKQANAKGYERMAEAVFRMAAEMDGVSVSDYLRRYESMEAYGPAIEAGSYNFADVTEELVADAFQMLAADEARCRSLIAELEQSNPTVLEQIKEFLQRMLETLEGLVKDGRFHAFAEDINKDIENTKKLQKIFAEELREAGRAAETKTQTAEQGTLEKVGVQIDNATQSAAPKMSLRTWSESDYAKDKEKAAKALAKAMDISVEKATKWIDDINGVAKIIADDRERLDYEANLDDTATVLKSNQEYKWTLDMSTLCAKRLWFTGTFDAIQKAMPDTAFTSEEITRIRTMMMEKGYEVACGICYVESTRREIGPITQMFIDQYKKAQKTGKPIARVNFQGKESELTSKGRVFYAEEGYTPTLADLNTTDIDLVKRDHPDVYAAYLAFMNARGQAKPKLLETRAEYKGEIAKTFRSKTAVKSRNAAGGLRVQSFSDFEVPHMIDMMQAVMDMAKVKLKAQAYTKVPAFAAVFGGTGMKINLSLIAKGDGVDSKGNLIFDDVEGIPHEEAFRLREQYSENVGTILVGKNDRHIITAMADPRIDFIIPFHKSSWKESLYDALGLTGYADYTATQNEKPIDKSRKIKNFATSEYWDYSKTGDENAQIYLEKCREDGRIPKFPEFSTYPGYWKLLIDFKMYDNDGVGSPQMEVQPEFNMKEARRILKAYEGGHRSFPVAQDVVDEFVAEKQDKKFSMRETVEEHKNLIAVHNITEDKLRKTMELEGIPMPSIAVMKSEANHKNFGEITMLFRKDTIDPKRKGNKVYGADAWTATFPKVDYEADEALAGDLDMWLSGLISKAYGKEVISRWVRKDMIYSSRTPEQSARILSRKDDIVAAYWMAKGKTPEQALVGLTGDETILDDIETKEGVVSQLAWVTNAKDVEDWLHNQLMKTISRRGIRNNKDTFTPSGNRRSFKSLHDDLTAENVVKAMKKQDDGVAVYGLSAAMLKGALGERFKSVEAIKKADKKLLNEYRKENETFAEAVNTFGYLMDRIREDAGDDIWWDSKTEAEEALLKQAKGKYTAESIRSALEGVGVYIEQDTAEEVEQLYNDLKEIPVLYFEAKPERVVSFDEVAAVFIPEEMNENLKKRVYGMFGDVIEYQTDYDWGINNRLTKINEFADEMGDIKFSVRESGEAELRRENASLISENKHLQKLNENLKKQFKLTDGKTPDPKSVRRVAKDWLKRIQSKADVEDFIMKLGKITEYFAKAEDKNDHDHAMAALRVLVREAMEEAETLNTEMRDSYSDLIDRIKDTTLKVTEAVREELEYYGGYNSFRREHFSSMTLNSQKGASIDSFYNELCSDYPEFFKEEDATTEGEQLMRISEVLDTLKPVAENPYGYYIDEYVYDETMGLLDKMADIQMEQTFADKKKAEKTAAMQKLKAEFNAEKQKMRDDAKAAKEKYEKELDGKWLAERMYSGRKQLEAAAKYQRLKDRNKANADKRKRSAYRKSAEKTLKELLNWMRKPNEKKHVQEAYLPLIQVLTKVDTGRKDIEIKQADVVSIVSKLDKLEKEGYASDLTDAVRNIANNFEDYFEDGMHLEDMTTEQMKALRDFIKGIKHIIVDNNKAKAMEQIERISDLGDGVIDKADKGKNVKATGRGRTLADFFTLELLTPNVFFKGITDSVHENLYKGLRTAHEQKASMVNEAMTFINEESRLKDRAKWERDKVREFTVSNGQKAYLTVPQIMSLYCHMKREQSKVHIVGGEIKQINGKTKAVQAGGIQIEPYDGRWTGLKNRKAAEAAMKQTERILVTEEDVKTITDTLTEQQKKLADAIQKFFSTVAAGWGNATSMLMWGYKNFLEPNYFPIESSEDFMVREYGVNADGRPVKQLKNLGFTHNTVTGANNPIIIRDIFSVFATHIDQMASYAAFVPILSDMQKFMNYKQYEQVGVTEDGKPVWKLKTSVSNALKVFMGLKAEGYINDLMRQINMAAGRDDTSSFPVQMTRRMKIAAVGANLRVMAQQPTSIVRAAAVINPVYLLNPANTALPADYRMMHKYAPISLQKKWGGADMDTGRTMKQMLTGGSWYDKTVDISMWGAGALDARTWGRLWKACVQETKAKNRELEGEELYLKAGQRFADVIDETQVVDTPLHRTAIMRKDSTLMKMATSFMSEPLKTYNMLFDIGRNLYQNPKDGKAYRKFVATSFTLFLNAVAVSAAAGLVDAMRDDDEDEEFWDKWMKAFKGDYSEVVTKKDFAMAALTSNLGDNMNPAAMIPFAKDAWSIIQGYDVERTDVTWMADMVNWAKNMIKFMEGDSKFTMQGMMKNTAENFSKMIGVPAKSLLRDLEALENTYINHIVKVDDVERIEEQIDKKARTHRMGSEDNLNYYIDKIVKLHFTGNNSLGAEYANKLVDSGIDSEKVQDRIDSALKARCKAETAAMEAAEAWLAKDYTTMESKLDELKDMGYSGEVAQSAMTSLYNKMVGEDDEPSAEEIKDPFDGDDVDYKKIYRADLKEAYENGGNTGRIENQLRSLGLKDKDINGVYRDKISNMFDKANAKGDKAEMERLIREYVKYNGKESTLRNRIK